MADRLPADLRAREVVLPEATRAYWEELRPQVVPFRAVGPALVAALRLRADFWLQGEARVPAAPVPRAVILVRRAQGQLAGLRPVEG